jgi:type II secretory ATPase GspE/PulE/Tfp pilus assembly ATPase PilB-like protein
MEKKAAKKKTKVAKTAAIKNDQKQTAPSPEIPTVKSLLTNKDDIALRELLVSGQYLSEESALEIESICLADGETFHTVCTTHDFLTDDLIGQAQAEAFNVPYADLNSNIPGQDQVKRIPEGVAKKYRAVIFREGEKDVFISTDEPRSKGISSAMKSIFKGKKVYINYSLSQDIDNSFIHYRKSLQTRLEGLTKTGDATAPKMVKEVFEEALIRKASDIHFEPRKETMMIRFRTDGVMGGEVEVPLEQYENVINHIKVMAQMRIDKHHNTQDGAIRYTLDEREIDMRVSIAPTITGEKIVIRILAEYIKGFSLSSLGLSDSDRDKLLQAIKKPFGLILVTGPTGSGKTTTLYALLKLLNKPTINITTIEDPVEYRVSGVNQIKVNEEAGITFAKGLRSIVRQDPDVILVGEIRDRETAEIAVNAALTGHLVLSTFHANDSATAIPRLIDMGVEPFLLASTLELVIAQRLVRKISEECRISYSVKEKDLNNKKAGLAKHFKGIKTLYSGSGCEEDGERKQYLGRTGIFEFIEMSSSIKDLVLTNPSTQEIWDIARIEGSKTLFEDGVIKVEQGVTSIDELLRVAEPPYVKKNQHKKK